MIAVGTTAVVVGADLLVDAAVSIMSALGVNEKFVGLTVVALGTSVPELATSVVAALKKEMDISLGNLVGSNVFNLVAVIGIVGLVQPFDPASPGILDKPALDKAFAQALSEDFYVVLGFSLAAILLPRVAPGSGRMKGIALLVCYGLYTLWLFKTRAL